MCIVNKTTVKTEISEISYSYFWIGCREPFVEAIHTLWGAQGIYNNYCCTDLFLFCVLFIDLICTVTSRLRISVIFITIVFTGIIGWPVNVHNSVQSVYIILKNLMILCYLEKLCFTKWYTQYNIVNLCCKTLVNGTDVY